MNQVKQFLLKKTKMKNIMYGGTKSNKDFIKTISKMIE